MGYDSCLSSWDRGDKPDQPVDRVSWFHALAYCNRLSQRFGIEEAYELSSVSGRPRDEHFKATVRWWGLACPGFRLPTEAEWEHACRAGADRPRYGYLNDIAWWDGNSGERIHPTGEKKPNAFGLYDMLGNMWEWCWDWHGDFRQDSVTDPVGPDSGSERAKRGGAYLSDARYARAPARAGDGPDERGCCGFRPVRSLA